MKEDDGNQVEENKQELADLEEFEKPFKGIAHSSFLCSIDMRASTKHCDPF